MIAPLPLKLPATPTPAPRARPRPRARAAAGLPRRDQPALATAGRWPAFACIAAGCGPASVSATASPASARLGSVRQAPPRALWPGSGPPSESPAGAVASGSGGRSDGVTCCSGLVVEGPPAGGPPAALAVSYGVGLQQDRRARGLARMASPWWLPWGVAAAWTRGRRALARPVSNSFSSTRTPLALATATSRAIVAAYLDGTCPSPHLVTPPETQHRHHHPVLPPAARAGRDADLGQLEARPLLRLAARRPRRRLPQRFHEPV